MYAIEPLDPVHLHLIRPFADAFVRSHPSLSFRSDYWSPFQDWLRGMCDASDSVVLAARDQTGTIGVGTGAVLENGPLLSPPLIGYVGFLVVLPASRRQGVGDRLWLELKKWFAARDVAEVQLYTQVDNELARTFWQHRSLDVVLERRATSLTIPW